MSPKPPAEVPPAASSFPIAPSPANQAKATQLQTKPSEEADEGWLWLCITVIVGSALIGYEHYRLRKRAQPQHVEFEKARDQGYGRFKNPDSAAFF